MGKLLLTLRGTYDLLLPMGLHSNRYRSLIENRGKGNTRRYYKIENGNHVDSYFDLYRQEPSSVCGPYCPATGPRLWTSRSGWRTKVTIPRPTTSRTVSHPTAEGTTADANNSSISQKAKYSPQGAPGS
jgi:hypothetical protein